MQTNFTALCITNTQVDLFSVMVLGDSSAQLLSCVQLFVNPGTVICQAPLATEFSRQEYWRGFPFPTPGDLPDLGIEPKFPGIPALANGFFTTGPPGKPIISFNFLEGI